MIAPPAPISRRSFRFRHFGQVVFALSVIDWNSSNACPHPSQT
jgi:hypothetical protein